MFQVRAFVSHQVKIGLFESLLKRFSVSYRKGDGFVVQQWMVKSTRKGVGLSDSLDQPGSTELEVQGGYGTRVTAWIGQPTQVGFLMALKGETGG
ncbi:MAG: hypothetical protein BWY72_01634 [Bacteroidetes bacterium ADurb.Bin416]|nr:MAG: hypothetical protein BWY72_01634 [Bacteroidetes bacterium ADurb.Bin416]